MHELSIAQSIAAIAEEHIEGQPETRVRIVRVKVGELAGVVPDSLEFCFSAAIAGTRLEGARLEIERVRGRGRCPSCGAITPVDGFTFLCAHCGGEGLTLVEGNELQVTELELDDDKGSNAMGVVTIERKVLEKNDAVATENRQQFRDNGIAVLNLVSSPGSGKTSLLERTLERLATTTSGRCH